MKKVVACAIVALGIWTDAAEAVDWPQEIDAPEGKIFVYQLQPEKLSGNVLTGRAATAIELKDKPEPVFGAFWFSAKIDTDQDEGTALVRDLHVTKVRWPDSTEAGQARFTEIVNNAVPKAGFEISLERLSASLASAEREQRSLASLKNDPPAIVFSEELAVLLLYDGAPRFRAIENSGYERALNTPFAVARDAKTKRVYLSSGTLWYSADDPWGPFAPTQSPPADLVKMLPPPDKDIPAPAKPPKIVVATKPTELIATDGTPKWKALAGDKLLYVENTETPWLRAISDQQMYVLLSGRWYRAKTQKGPWSFVRPDQLPVSFKDIPPDSPIGGVRTSVAGTPEAEEAVLAAAIPQTAAIKRSEAKLEVQYDGAPKFEKIAGTNVSYAVNTGAQVLEINQRYYAVDNGVWFTSASPTGPWTVADKVPKEEIDKIPPSSPVYNVTYVTIYDSTPEVVYVGYTSGYLWSYPYYGVPVYGTGWYYPPYWGPVYYYPRPPTWGFHVGYNPWTGWNFGVSWTNGFFSFGVSWGGGYGPYPPYRCCGGWYGGGYRPPMVVHHGDINIGNTINAGNRANVSDRMAAAGDRARPGQNNNLYNRPENRARVADRATATRDLQQPRPATGRDNNVYADRNGNVARRTGDQWETRDQGVWKPEPSVDDRTPEPRQPQTPPSRETRPAPTPSTPSFDRADMNRSYQARQSGAAQERMRPAPRAGGGGGRRR
ncbi:MAG: carbohydrate-binding family V/XII [Nitrospirota bacterium]